MDAIVRRVLHLHNILSTLRKIFNCRTHLQWHPLHLSPPLRVASAPRYPPSAFLVYVLDPSSTLLPPSPFLLRMRSVYSLARIVLVEPMPQVEQSVPRKVGISEAGMRGPSPAVWISERKLYLILLLILHSGEMRYFPDQGGTYSETINACTNEGTHSSRTTLISLLNLAAISFRFFLGSSDNPTA